jgi:hypothetical protein
MQYSALHPESRAFLGSWRALNGLDGQEEGQNALSKDASSLVDRLFLAQRVGEGVFTFRTVGNDLKIWTGRDLRDHEIGSIFHGPDKVLIRALLEAAVAAPGPALARAAAFGAGHGQRSEVEIVFLPLIEKGVADRILGLFQPVALNTPISKPILRFALTALLPPAPPEPVRHGLRVVVRND